MSQIFLLVDHFEPSNVTETACDELAQAIKIHEHISLVGEKCSHKVKEGIELFRDKGARCVWLASSSHCLSFGEFITKYSKCSFEARQWKPNSAEVVGRSSSSGV